ncbi:acetyl-CoA hydrolase/transferase C-terminal domain-containing protein [Pontibacter sp. G13]|uniref:acetyl-CoA hydrolase/transferase family protein n=1 Tax=Pontibacter sp. G13 TaxID=3074898 RepID=UPI00288A5C12|nr:acetyl-CoA hydrolase/transferase C-terminal domain-containing protein [Pontibacter sp. G13]WNJ17735.1 acetyl-CoA hydrolase/transferase C-terminal domain-containing protein [Pontibacter sp. G13]
MKPFVSADKALQAVKSGSHVFIHTAAAAPQVLVKALAGRAPEVKGVQIYQMHTDGEAPYANPQYMENFSINCFFIGANVRPAIKTGQASYIPVFLSEVPLLLRREVIKIDVALISVSPPDKHGFCSMGPSVDATRAAVEMADVVIAQVNRHMPRTHGEGWVNVKDIDYLVEGDVPLPTHPEVELTDIERSIGRHVAGLVEDGATLQLGIGAIPNATLEALADHKNLGIHTEMFSDGVIPLVESGVINNSMKHRQQGKIVSAFVIGTQKVYDFIDDNPYVTMMDAQYVNSTNVIRRHPKVTAINSAIEVDLTGQICADSIGHNMYSGVGGQMDFIRAASLSQGGKPIIALPSTTRKGIPRIVPHLKSGAGVVTTRAHVHFVVTEYGVADLKGKTLRQRSKALLEIAHPDHREELERQAFEFYGQHSISIPKRKTDA